MMKKLPFILLFLSFFATRSIGQITVSLPDLNTSVSVGSIIEIPVTVGNLTGSNVIAYQFQIGYNSDVLIPESPYFIKSGTLSNATGWSVMANPNVAGQLTLGAFGSSALSGNGTLLKLTFKVLTASGSSPLVFNSFLFNAGNPAALATNGSFSNQICSEIQTLVIPAGWSGISTFVEVSNPDMVNMFAPVQNHLIMVKNNSNSYSPPNGILPTQSWNSYSGYFIKMDEQVILQVCGQDLQNKSLNLTTGWNLIPVLNDCVYFCEEILYGLDYEYVQSAAGLEVYWPSKAIQTLYFFEPGKAYLLKMNSPGIITFNECK